MSIFPQKSVLDIFLDLIDFLSILTMICVSYMIRMIATITSMCNFVSNENFSLIIVNFFETVKNGISWNVDFHISSCDKNHEMTLSLIMLVIVYIYT